MLDTYEHVVIDTPPNLGLLTVNALVCAERVLGPVSAEDEESLDGILELRRRIARLAERPSTVTPELAAVLTRWHPHRLASRRIEDAPVRRGSHPSRGIRARSAVIARAAARRVALAVSDPNSVPCLLTAAWRRRSRR